MSALLTTTMPSMSGTIKALQEAGVREQVKVMIGGAPVTDGFARPDRRGRLLPGRQLGRAAGQVAGRRLNSVHLVD